MVARLASSWRTSLTGILGHGLLVNFAAWSEDPRVTAPRNETRTHPKTKASPPGLRARLAGQAWVHEHPHLALASGTRGAKAQSASPPSHPCFSAAHLPHSEGRARPARTCRVCLLLDKSARSWEILVSNLMYRKQPVPRSRAVSLVSSQYLRSPAKCSLPGVCMKRTAAYSLPAHPPFLPTIGSFHPIYSAQALRRP